MGSQLGRFSSRTSEFEVISAECRGDGRGKGGGVEIPGRDYERTTSSCCTRS